MAYFFKSTLRPYKASGVSYYNPSACILNLNRCANESRSRDQFGVPNNRTLPMKSTSQCLKITQNVAFDFFYVGIFPGLSYLSGIIV